MHDEFDVDVSLPLPNDWDGAIRSAVLNIVVLVRIATLAAREFLIEEGDVVHAKLFRLEAEVANHASNRATVGHAVRHVQNRRLASKVSRAIRWLLIVLIQFTT